MANANAPTGLSPARHLTGGEVRLSEHYSIASGYSTSIFRGDPVELTATSGQIQVAADNNVDNLGVFWGCSYIDSAGNPVFKPYWPASTTATSIVAYVYDDPNIEYEIQADTCTVAAIGQLVDFSVATASTGSTVTGLSGYFADLTTGTATTGKNLRIMGIVNRPDNVAGQYAKIRVVFAEHALSRVVSGVGGI